jgi:hypothetical protein
VKDTTGKDLQLGDFIIYFQQGGRTKLYFGIITRMNPKTNKIWVHHMEHDRTPLMKQVWTTLQGYINEYEEVGVSLINYTDADRFYIL